MPSVISCTLLADSTVIVHRFIILLFDPRFCSVFWIFVVQQVSPLWALALFEVIL